MAKNRYLSLALVIVKVAISIVIIGVILYNVNLGDALDRLRGAQWSLIVLALICLALQVILNAFRWSVISRAAGVPLPPLRAISYLWESLFFAQFLPAGVGGDAWRVFQLSKLGSGLTASVHSVFLDRVAGALALLFLILGGAIVAPLFSKSEDIQVLILALAMLAAIGLGLAALALMIHLPARFDVHSPVRALRRLSLLSRGALTDPSVLANSLTTGIVAHVIAVASAWLIALAIGFPVSFLDCMLIVPIALLLAMIPITIGGWGMREGAIVAGFVRVGGDSESALAVSLTYGVLWAIIGVIGGAIWLSRGASARADARAAKKLAG